MSRTFSWYYCSSWCTAYFPPLVCRYIYNMLYIWLNISLHTISQRGLRRLITCRCCSMSHDQWHWTVTKIQLVGIPRTFGPMSQTTDTWLRLQSKSVSAAHAHMPDPIHNGKDTVDLYMTVLDWYLPLIFYYIANNDDNVCLKACNNKKLFWLIQ